MIISRYKGGANADLTGVTWMKSSHSGGNGQCVEVADLTATPHASIAIRDSKNPDGPMLTVTPAEFTSFISELQGTAFDA